MRPVGINTVKLLKTMS